MSVRLTCVDAVSTTPDVELAELPATIGRGHEADVCLADCWASRIHCMLFEQHGQLWVRDLGSSNGTRVNGAVITEAAVRSGDQVTIGLTTLRIRYRQMPKTVRSMLELVNA